MSVHAVRGRSRYPGSIDLRLLAPVIIPMTNLALWLAADNLSLADGALISSWNDASGNANNATQGTDAAKPTFKTNILNGKPVVRFDGGDSLGLTTEIVASPFSIFTVLKPAGSGYRTIAARANTGSALQIRVNTAAKIELVKSAVAIFATSTTALSASAFSYLMASYSNPNYTFRLNGAADGSGSSAQTLAAVNLVGANYDGYRFNGDIAEMIIYGAILSTADRDAVESYLKTKYGL